MNKTHASALIALFSVGVFAHSGEGEGVETRYDPASGPVNSEYASLIYGDRTTLGDGRISTIQSVRADGTPRLIGIEFPKSVLRDLPEEHSDGLNCWDSNGDDAIDLEECDGGHERILFFDKNKSPFSSIVINWESHGHVPAGVYDTPHFDFHFYIMDNIARRQIAVGPCAGVMNCAQTETAILPLRSGYIHPDYFNTKLTYARMGNHWADSRAPEFNGGNFTHSFILGSYDSSLTFYEPMVSLDYLLSKPNQCTPIKQPLLFEKAGYYPKNYCIRYFEKAAIYRITLEQFEYRNATP